MEWNVDPVLLEAVRAVVSEEPYKVRQYHRGKGIVGFVVGRVRERYRGIFVPDVVARLVTEELDAAGAELDRG